MPHPAYGPEHQAIRTAMLLALPTMPLDKASPQGRLCPRCGQEMKRWQPLDLGHTNPADKAAGRPGDRLEHSACNRSAGPSAAVHPGVGYEASRRW